MLSTLLVKKKALEAGFDLVGIAPADTFNDTNDTPPDTPKGAPNDLKFAREWWEKGYGGEMRYLANPKRYDPGRVLHDARSLISVALVYNTPLPRSVELASGEGSRGWVSRYAWGEDYHRILKRKLEALCRALRQTAPEAELLPYVDTGPVIERAFARLSGIGWMGKNTCIIHPGKGSWFFLGAILTDLDLEPDPPCARPLRQLHAMPCGLSHRRLRRSLRDGRLALYLLLHHRASRGNPRAFSGVDGQPRLRLRHLPGRLPVEPESGHCKRIRVSAAAPEGRRAIPRCA